MELTLNENNLKEIDCIINHFLENNKNEETSISSLAFCLQKLIDGREELAEALAKREDD